jgi:hypothetical protein
VVHVLVQQRQAVKVQGLGLVVGRQQIQRARQLTWASSARVRSASGSGSCQRRACATRLELYKASASARTGGERLALRVGPGARMALGVAPIQWSWNQPMWPSSHRGGFSAGS